VIKGLTTEDTEDTEETEMLEVMTDEQGVAVAFSKHFPSHEISISGHRIFISEKNDQEGGK
jgi:hypothetical protein